MAQRAKAAHRRKGAQPVLLDVELRQSGQRRQALGELAQVVALQPQLHERGEAAELRRQPLDAVVGRPEHGEPRIRAERGGQLRQVVLADVQYGEVRRGAHLPRATSGVPLHGRPANRSAAVRPRTHSGSASSTLPCANRAARFGSAQPAGSDEIRL